MTREAEALAPTMKKMEQATRSLWHDFVVDEAHKQFPAWTLAFDGPEALVWKTADGELIALDTARGERRAGYYCTMGICIRCDCAVREDARRSLGTGCVPRRATCCRCSRHPTTRA